MRRCRKEKATRDATYASLRAGEEGAGRTAGRVCTRLTSSRAWADGDQTRQCRRSRKIVFCEESDSGIQWCVAPSVGIPPARAHDTPQALRGCCRRVRGRAPPRWSRGAWKECARVPRLQDQSSALRRYSASSACLGDSSSGSIAARASCAAEGAAANRPNCCGASSACGAMSDAWVSRPRCSSSASRRRACCSVVLGRPASAATCRPKLRSAAPYFTACMKTSVSPCSTASRCTLAMPLPGSPASAVNSK